MTKKAYYLRNWTQGPPPKKIIDHTHQPHGYALALWKVNWENIAKDEQGYYLIDGKGNRHEISSRWYQELRVMNRHDYNMYHQWFRHEIHFSDFDGMWMTFKAYEDKNIDDERYLIVQAYRHVLTAKQRQIYDDLANGLKQKEIAQREGVSEYAITKRKQSMIKKLRKAILEEVK